MSTVVNEAADSGRVPRDYAELYAKYHTFVRRRVIARGIEEQNADDVTSELLLRFMERGSLEKYDPEKRFPTAGRMRTASFETYLGGHVDITVQGHRDKQNKQRTREPLVCDLILNANGGTATWAQVYEERFGVSQSGHEEDVLAMVVTEGLVGQMREYLATIPPRNAYDKCDLVAVLDGVVQQILHLGYVDFEVLAEQLGVSATSVNKYYWRMRELLCQATGRPIPRKRPRAKKNELEA